MRVSFDLDEVLFVSPETHKTEPQLPFPFCRIFRERLRLGTPELINTLQCQGLDTYGDANADALTLASEKLKDTFNDNTEWFGLEEEQEDTEEE